MRTGQGKIRTRMAVGLVLAAAIAVAIVALVTIDPTGRAGSGLSRQYDLDIAALAAFDPNLLLYREDVPAVATGFVRSRALVVDANGLLCVAGDKAVHVLDRAGKTLRSVTLAGEPQCLFVLVDGTLYVGLRDHVEVIDPKGQRQATWPGLGERAFLTSITASGSDVFLADAGNAVVIRCDATGKIIERMTGSPSEPFVAPSHYFDVAVASDGRLRVADPGRCRIETYTLRGDMESAWGRNSARIDGFCGCCNPVNFAMLPDGGYVTAEKGLVRVKVCNADGSLRAVVAGPEQLVEGGAARVFQSAADALASGFDVAADSHGRVYVLDTIKNAVRVFVRKGEQQ
jgi:hypothetical protein